MVGSRGRHGPGTLVGRGGAVFSASSLFSSLGVVNVTVIRDGMFSVVTLGVSFVLTPTSKS